LCAERGGGDQAVMVIQVANWIITGAVDIALIDAQQDCQMHHAVGLYRGRLVGAVAAVYCICIGGVLVKPSPPPPSPSLSSPSSSADGRDGTVRPIYCPLLSSIPLSVLSVIFDNSATVQDSVFVGLLSNAIELLTSCRWCTNERTTTKKSKENKTKTKQKKKVIVQCIRGRLMLIASCILIVCDTVMMIRTKKLLKYII
jgi:hypothetical protein